MTLSPTARADLVRLALAGVGVVCVEWILWRGAGTGHPLDPEPRTAWALVAVWGLLAALAGVGRLVARGGGLPVAVVGWSALAWTELAHVRGESPWLWALPLVPIVVASLRFRRAAAWLIPLSAMAVPLGRPTVEPSRTGPGQTRLLVVTVDTIRSDHDLLAQAGLVGGGWQTGTALAPAPWTPPSMTSLWLAADVSEHGGGIEVDGRLSEPVAGWGDSWPSRLARSGRHLEAVTSNVHLRPEAGFGEGFAAVWHDDQAREPHLLLHTLDATVQRVTGRDTYRGRTRDDRIVHAAVDRLTSKTAPDVLWVHLLEPHEYARRASSSAPIDLRRAYERCVTTTADRLRILVENSPDADILIVGDHGEDLGEQGRWGHGRAPTRAVLQVPYALRTAKGRASPDVAGPSLVDLGRWLGQHTPGASPHLEVGTVPVIAGVRGHPDQRYRWSPGLGVATPVSGGVTPGPLAPEATPAVRAALRHLGYVDH